MQFTPKSEKELAEEGLFPAGVYPYEILDAEDTVSKSGNPMIKLKMRIFSGSRTNFIDDYLLEAFGFKLRHAAVTLGMESSYDSGELDALDFKGKSGWAKVGIQKDKKGEFPDRNTVLDYVGQPKDKATPTAEVEENDDIPF